MTFTSLPDATSKLHTTSIPARSTSLRSEASRSDPGLSSVGSPETYVPKRCEPERDAGLRSGTSLGSLRSSRPPASGEPPDPGPFGPKGPDRSSEPPGLSRGGTLEPGSILPLPCDCWEMLGCSPVAGDWSSSVPADSVSSLPNSSRSRSAVMPCRLSSPIASTSTPARSASSADPVLRWDRTAAPAGVAGCRRIPASARWARGRRRLIPPAGYSSVRSQDA